MSGKSLPIGSFTERKISQVVQGTTGVAPIALTLLGPSKVLMEFERSTSVVEVAMILHALSDCDNLKIQTHCVMARCESLVDMFREKEESEKEKQLLRKEKIKYQSQLGQVVERIGSQIEVRSKDRIRWPCNSSRNCYSSHGEPPTGGATTGYGSRTAFILWF